MFHSTVYIECTKLGLNTVNYVSEVTKSMQSGQAKGWTKRPCNASAKNLGLGGAQPPHLQVTSTTQVHLPQYTWIH